MKKFFPDSHGRLTVLAIVLILVFSGCGNGTGNKKKVSISEKTRTVQVPDFNEDSAWHYLVKQIEFGPRIPETRPWSECAEWMKGLLDNWCDTAIVQQYESRLWDGRVANGKNIIGIFNPGKSKRIMLCAHWDSREFADHDPDPAKRNQPVPGANDGASGVAVLLELARIMNALPPSVGVDLVLFDLEDQGPPQDKQQRTETSWWGLGSQYWSHNPHQQGYFANYVVLLDMVGTRDAVFTMEGFSMYYAPDVVKKVWQAARHAGYGSFFPYEQGTWIDDDHKNINEIIKLPAIDIIHLDPNSVNGTFFDYWHTTEDTPDKLNKESLKAVGQTLAWLLYHE